MTFSADIRRHDRDDRAARTTARLLAAGLFVVVLGAVVAFSVYTVRRDARSDEPAQPEALPTSPTESGVGPVPGTDLGRYVETAGQVLSAATGDRVAVVSLTSYKTEAEARRVVGDLPVVSLLVALPGRPPAATSDLGRWLEEQKAAERAEREEIERLIPTVDDPAFKTFYADEVARLTKAIDSITPEVVFAVVVRGPALRLRVLSSMADVRVVDVAPADLGANPGFRGFRPEEIAVAAEPATRPI